MRTLVVLSLAGLIGAAGALAEDASIRLENPWVRRAAAMPDSGPGTQSRAAGYLTIVNHGAARDALVSAVADVAERVELHETRNMSGMLMMEPVSRVDVEPGARVELKPGSYHLMLIGVKRALTPGQTVTLTLRFERAGPMTTRADVR
jgi:periplasmic copper chaperone A